MTWPLYPVISSGGGLASRHSGMGGASCCGSGSGKMGAMGGATWAAAVGTGFGVGCTVGLRSI